MNFNSLAFLIFLPIVLLAYWILPHRFRWILLLGASYFFYMSWNVQLVWLIMMTTLISYLAALIIEKHPKYRPLLLGVTLTVCLGALLYFKYFEFLVGSAFSLISFFQGNGGNAVQLSFHILLPVGISFYTFQTMSYVIDVYRGDCPAEHHLGYYALFVSYFPQLVAGPIESAENLLPQLKKEQRFREEDMRMGFRLLLSGFFRKCAVADFCGIYVNHLFADTAGANSLAVLMAGGLFCIQMYCDFAGYSEIAMGAARLMGIRLMRNFDRPYLSVSYTEFFRRWHISLNRWFTSYVYIPLGGGRKGTARKIRNTFVVFWLCGLWHGANWTYVLWGMYAAFWLSLESIFKKPFRAMAEKRNICLKAPEIVFLRRCIMMLVFIPAALLFRSGSPSQAGMLLARLFTEWGVGAAYLQASFDSLGMAAADLVQIVVSICCMCLIYPLSCEQVRDIKYRQVHRTMAYVYMILAIAAGWLALLATQANASFAYFQF